MTILGYALNAFPYEDLGGMLTVLRRDAPAIKRAVFPHAPFPIELRFSHRIAESLRGNRRALDHLRALLHERELQLVTVNGFVPLSFHHGHVKERVYLPRWDAPADRRNSRVAFTNDCVSLLAELMDGATSFGSVSVPAGILKRDVPSTRRSQTERAIAAAIAQCVCHAALVHERTGRHIMIGLEPEPGLTSETTAEVTRFFERHLWKLLTRDLRGYVGVNFDLCHQLVEWEDPFESVHALLRHGIPLTKLHVSNAIQLDHPSAPASSPQLARLRQFYANSKFLHQTIGVNKRGRPVFSVLDLPQALSSHGHRALRRLQVQRLRVHYHMPLFESPDAPIHTTLAEVRTFLRRWRSETARRRTLRQVPLIIETYTWLEQLRDDATEAPAALRARIIEELRAVQSYLA